jgi:hypothetical protein
MLWKIRPLLNGAPLFKLEAFLWLEPKIRKSPPYSQKEGTIRPLHKPSSQVDEKNPLCAMCELGRCPPITTQYLKGEKERTQTSHCTRQDLGITSIFTRLKPRPPRNRRAIGLSGRFERGTFHQTQPGALPTTTPTPTTAMRPHESLPKTNLSPASRAGTDRAFRATTAKSSRESTLQHAPRRRLFERRVLLKQEEEEEAAARTDLNGRNAEAARLEGDADAAGRDALAEPAHHPAGDKHVLHLAPASPLSHRRLLLLSLPATYARDCKSDWWWWWTRAPQEGEGGMEGSGLGGQGREENRGGNGVRPGDRERV